MRDLNMVTTANRVATLHLDPCQPLWAQAQLLTCCLPHRPSNGRKTQPRRLEWQTLADPPMSLSKRTDSSNRIARLGIAALLFAAVFPAGVMPASITSDWMFQLCPDGLSTSVVAALHPSDDPHAHHDADAARGFDCPFAAFAPQDLAYAGDTGALVADACEATADGSDQTAAVGYTSRSAHRPRGPPLVTKLS